MTTFEQIIAGAVLFWGALVIAALVVVALFVWRVILPARRRHQAEFDRLWREAEGRHDRVEAEIDEARDRIRRGARTSERRFRL